MGRSVAVKPITTALQRFQSIKLQWKVYRDDPFWVPPLLWERMLFLDPRTNPFLRRAEVQLFGAYRDKTLVGTIAAIVNPEHNEVHKDEAGFFGLFECKNDELVAFALLETAANWLRARGRTFMRGPMSFSTHDMCGLLVEGFDSSPAVGMPHNPAHYQQYVEAFGATKVQDLYAYRFRILEERPENLETTARKVAELASDVTLRAASHADLVRQSGAIRELYNQTLSKNWGFIPLSEEDFGRMIDTFKHLMDPELMIFAGLEGQTVGYALALPDYNQLLKPLDGKLFPFGVVKLWRGRKEIRSARVMLIGVKPRLKKGRLGALLSERLWQTCLEKGIEWIEASWVSESNWPMNLVLQEQGFSAVKTYRVYDYALR